MLRTFARSLKRIGSALTQGALVEPEPRVLFRFDAPRDVERWHAFSDAYFGGRSRAAWRRAEDGGEPAAEFSGRLSTELSDDADLARAGYCCASSKIDAVGDVLDLDEYRDLVYVVRGDGRSYLANVRTDTIGGAGGGDVWQAPFRTRPGGAWAEVRIPFSAFMMTRRGRVVAQRAALPRDSIVSVGVSVSAHCDGAGGESGSSGGGGGLPYLSAAARGGAGASDESHNRSSETSDSAGTFRLLLREIRAEGRALS